MALEPVLPIFILLLNKNVFNTFYKPGTSLGAVIHWYMEQSCPSGAYIFREEKSIRKKINNTLTGRSIRSGKNAGGNGA